MIPCRVRRAALSGLLFANSKAKRLAIRLTRWTGTSSDLVSGHSLPFYLRHSEIRRCLPRRYPGKNAGFSAVCGAT